jgi:phosphoglycerate dehydrogenase-like enzyme
MRKAKSQSPPPSARADGKIHLHVENTGELGPVFEASPERVAAALKDHPGVAERLHITIGYDGDIIERELRDADILFAWNFDRTNLVERAPRLRWVHAHGAGVNHLMPLTWLPKGAVLTNSRGVHAERASEYAIMAVLMLNNRLPEMVTNQRQGRWQQLFNSAVTGKTLLIVGVGHVGGSVASWAKRFGMRVIGIRRTGRNHRSVDAMHRPADLPKLLPEADFVLITAPHTDATHHLIGAGEIALFKRGAGLVNYSRANLVDYEALRGRLERGEISAVLDVFSPEPLPSSSPLWQTPNLIITPHSSSDDTERYTPRTLDLVMRNMERFLSGKALMNRVSPKLQY